MIERPTVLVLGAGASAEYGFPTGRELLRQMLHHLDPDRQGTMVADYLSVLVDAGFAEERLIAFRNSLAEARVGSVDAFIAKRPVYRRIGRAAIAVSLIPCETEDGLHRAPEDPGWVELLFRFMTHSREPFEENQVSVVTFNYDRSFEHIMYSALSNLYSGGSPGAREKLASIPIVHLHGTLGRYPPLNHGRGRRYEPVLDKAVVKRVEKAIKIIQDNDENDGPLESDGDFLQAYDLLEEAELVVFLGFGFDLLNVRRLGLAEYISPSAQVIATAKGLEKTTMRAVEEACGVRGRFEHLDITCTELLRQRERQFKG